MAKEAEIELTPDEGSGMQGRKKLLLILGLAVVLLLGGGAAAFFLLGGDTAAPGEEPQEASVPPAPGEPSYYVMAPEFVVNLPPGGKAKMLQVELQVYTSDPAMLDLLKKHDPMLRHYLFDVLASEQADSLFTRAGRETLQARLRDTLVAKLKGVGVSKPAIDDVYFTQFVLQ